MKYLAPLDLAQNEIRNAVLQNLSSAPSAPKTGQLYYGTSGNVGFLWNGTSYRPVDAAALTDGSIQIAAIGAFQSTVLGYRLDQFAAPTNPVGFNGQRATSAANATQSTDLVPYGQMQTAITAALAGQTSIKNPARVYAPGNITLSGTQTIDSVSVAVGDRVLVANQTTPSQNGLYVVASGAWALASDASAASQWLEGTEILVAEGAAYGGSIFSQTTASPTLTTLAFTQRNKINAYLADGTTLKLTGFTFSVQLVSAGGIVGSASGLLVDTTVVARKYSATITHDGTTVAFPITHGLGTTDTITEVRDSSGNKVLADSASTSATVTTFTFGSAQTSGATFRVTIVG